MARLLFIAAAILLSIHAQAGADQPESESSQSPNIIMVMIDDQGWGDVGFNGHSAIQTPHLDAMAAAGVKFNRFYAVSPLCSPTRGSCLTGRYPFRFGVLAAHTAGMRVGEFTVAEMVKSKGYNTAFFGKWHLGWVRTEDIGSRGFFSPPGQHGFDNWFATTSAVPTWDPCVTPDDWDRWGNKPGQPWKGGTPYVADGQAISENMQGDDSRIIMDRAVKFIEANQNDPFLATIWFHTPHEPVVAGPEYKKLYPDVDEERKNYYGCITAMDEQIGRLRTLLDKLNLTDNTVIFFCSDNGPADNLTKRKIATTGGFKGHKHKMYEGGLLVPSCAIWPGKIAAGSETDVRCATVDYFPTIANLVGFKFKEKQARPIDGVDLMPIVNGESTPREKTLYFGYQRLHNGIDGQSVINGDWKLLREAKRNPRLRLYNLAGDPYEKNDIASSNPEMVKTLQAEMKAIEESCRLSRDGNDYRY